MKFFNWILAVTLITAVSTTVGCGSGEDEQVNGIGAPGAALNTIPAPGAGVTVPAGCYYNGTSNCAPCPTGYVQNGQYCTQSGNFGCPQGYTQTSWGSCVPSGVGCNNGMNWSWNYNGCYGVQNSGTAPQYSNYYCPSNMVRYNYYTRMYEYVCYPIYNAPATGYYFNGWGWYSY